MDSMDGSLEDLVAMVQRELRARANPDDAGPMQAYMKSEQPFYGVTRPNRQPVVRAMRAYPPHDQPDWQRRILALWNLPHREERYMALDYMTLWRQYHKPAALPLCKRLAQEGAWWDLADWVAGRVVSPILLAHRDQTRPIMEVWIEDENMWVRRMAILSQLKHKDRTDVKQLFDFCLQRADEEEFFIRKAVGWALRDYSWTNPDGVRDFLADHGEELSPLSRREAGKHLAKISMLP